MTPTLTLNKDQARRFLIRYQHLSDAEGLRGTNGVETYMSQMGCIQYDPLNMLARNADLVLQARVRDYRPEMLFSLLYEKRSLIDGWDKMMSIYPATDWPYFRRVRVRRGAETIATLGHRRQTEALSHTDSCLAALSEAGAQMPKGIKLGAAEPGSWGHRNLSSVALDYLFHVGKVGVSTKKNVNKVYDLIERLLPAEILAHPEPFATEHDFLKWYVYRRIGSIGLLWNKNGGGWLASFLGNKKERQQLLDELLSEGSIRCVAVEGVTEPFYIRTKDVDLLDCDDQTLAAVRFIAPLDNLIWDRAMLSTLFDFDYTWEVYVPAAKRKFGYYVLPVLHGERFIGRFEPEKSSTHMRIKNWWWEDGVEIDTELIERILREMERLAACFHKTEGVCESVAKIIKGTSA